MNPWGFVAIGLGILLVIMGVMGTYGNVQAAITGHAPKGQKSTGPTTGGGPFSFLPPFIRNLIPGGNSFIQQQAAQAPAPAPQKQRRRQPAVQPGVQFM